MNNTVNGTILIFAKKKKLRIKSRTDVYSLQAKSGLLPVSANKVLLKYNYTHLIYILYMAPDFILTAESSTCDRSYGPQNLKYLLKH